MDTRDRVLDAALAFHAATTRVRSLSAQLRAAPDCVSTAAWQGGERACFGDDAFKDGGDISHYCDGCRQAALVARERHLARLEQRLARARVERAAEAFSRTLWAVSA